MVLEGEMLRDDLVSALELKRKEHLANVWKKYEEMGSEEKEKTQVRLIKKYNLNKIQVEKEILGIVKAVVEKRMKSKNDMIQTSSSIKQKCGIRIRKTKKVI